jgi:hypothetical protein
MPYVALGTTAYMLLWGVVIAGFVTGLWLVWSWARRPDAPPPTGEHDEL